MEQKTANYRIIADAGGNRYSFYCGLSGALGCTTPPLRAPTPGQELALAWQEGRRHFNLCQKCGRWVIGAAFNPEVCECTDCAPFEHEAAFCKLCGAKVGADVRFCPVCKNKLHYEGGAVP